MEVNQEIIDFIEMGYNKSTKKDVRNSILLSVIFTPCICLGVYLKGYSPSIMLFTLFITTSFVILTLFVSLYTYFVKNTIKLSTILSLLQMGYLCVAMFFIGVVLMPQSIIHNHEMLFLLMFTLIIVVSLSSCFIINIRLKKSANKKPKTKGRKAMYGIGGAAGLLGVITARALYPVLSEYPITNLIIPILGYLTSLTLAGFTGSYCLKVYYMKKYNYEWD